MIVHWIWKKNAYASKSEPRLPLARPELVDDSISYSTLTQRKDDDPLQANSARLGLSSKASAFQWVMILAVGMDHRPGTTSEAKAAWALDSIEMDLFLQEELSESEVHQS
jgi:hypothetical protein